MTSITFSIPRLRGRNSKARLEQRREWAELHEGSDLANAYLNACLACSTDEQKALDDHYERTKGADGSLYRRITDASRCDEFLGAGQLLIRDVYGELIDQVIMAEKEAAA